MSFRECPCTAPSRHSAWGLVSGRGSRDPSRSPRRGVKILHARAGRIFRFSRLGFAETKGAWRVLCKHDLPNEREKTGSKWSGPLEADCYGVALGLALMPQTRRLF